LRLFKADLQKYYRIECGTDRPPFRRKLKLWFTNFGLHCVAVYRLGRFSRACMARGNWLCLPLLLIYEVLAYLIRFFHHVDVFAASIGPGFYIGHVGTIYVGRCRIGENFSITHNVTLGVGSTGPVHGLPTVGNNVWVGTGSVLYGHITVGSGVTVNCGSVLSRSVPDRCLVGGNPARVILKNHDNAGLFGVPVSAPAAAVEHIEDIAPADTPPLPEAPEPALMPLAPFSAAAAGAGNAVKAAKATLANA
jgi:serine O-acetyltransferase